MSTYRISRLLATLGLLTLAVALSFASADDAKAGSYSTSAENAGDSVAALLGAGASPPTVSNITYTGAPNALGVFTDAAAPPVMGLSSGVIMSSGSIHNIDGPNNSGGISAGNGTAGDSDLDGISVFTTFDAAVLEFDFECDDIDRISFRYVFGSDEYNEWVGTNFNDPFAFFLNGANIALVPGGGGPVTVTNVSLTSNSAYYINNDSGTHDTQADGFTVVMIAEAAINPGVNHIKLAIADAGDSALDSWVLIEGGSFTCGSINENQPPEITVPADIVAEATGPLGTTVSYMTSATDAEDDDVLLSASITCDHAGYDFPIGTTVVTCEVTDSGGASDSATFTVTVQDTIAPELTTTDVTVEAIQPVGQPVAYPDPPATDAVGVVSITCTPPSGATFPIGDTVVNCEAADAAGNIGEASFTVTVQDTIAPVVTCEETHNPSGKNVPKAGKNAGKSGQNPDGFYVIGASDSGSGIESIFLSDTGSDSVFGSWESGTVIKLTQAPGVAPNAKPGSGSTDWKVQLNGDGEVLVTDVAGNTSTASCLVPQPPK